MPPTRRFVPLAIILLLLAAGLYAWLPTAIRVAKLRRACTGMLEAAAAGDLAGVLATVESSQAPEVEALFGQFVPPGYEQSIASLKLTRSGLESEIGWTEVVCRFEGAATGVYLGRLRWLWRGSGWEWDFLGSEGAEFALSDPQWRSLSSLLPDAGRL